MTSRCCAPGPQAADAGRGRPPPPESRGSHHVEQASVPAGPLQRGDHHDDGDPADGEQPVHTVDVAAFSIDATTVTNSDFSAFAASTGWCTEAEQTGASAVFHSAVRADDTQVVGPVPGTPWWTVVRGASWRHPAGPASDARELPDHPVVHVSWNDAAAYAAWAGRRLPSESQWEQAARGGLRGARYPWGDEAPDAGGIWRCNIFQGSFPQENTAADGFATTAPVRSYRPNGWGVWQSVGNVWEWCADWFDPHAYERAARGLPVAPVDEPSKVLRGGSYLCHDSYCNRYRVAARTRNGPRTTAANIGFRTVAA